MRTEKTAEVKEFRLRLEHLKTHKDHSTRLKSEIAEGQETDRQYTSQINELHQEAQVLPHQTHPQCTSSMSCSMTDFCLACAHLSAPLHLTCCSTLKEVDGTFLCVVVQGIQRSMDSNDVKLNRIADFGDRLKELKTQHSMTVKQNADTFVKLQARC